MHNERIREYARRKGVRLWQIAEALEMHDSSFSKMLRHELPQDVQERIMSLIDRMSAEGGEKEE